MKSIYNKLSNCISYIAISCMALMLVACHNQQTIDSSSDNEIFDANDVYIDVTNAPLDDVIVLYTNDVHCAVSENIGYAGLSSYRQTCLDESPYVTLVDLGDFAQGGSTGAISKGTVIIDIMNEVGYDVCIPGNHEFDYGEDNFYSLVARSEAEFVACNIDGINDYKIIDYGEISVGYIGVTTPLFEGEYADSLSEHIQETVDGCKALGADYIILLSHLGDTEEYSPYSSVDIASQTYDIDVILDGHAHNVIGDMIVKNKEGKDVHISSTGSKLTNIGKLVIGIDGSISTELISDYSYKDDSIEVFISEIEEEYSDVLKEIVAYSDVSYSIYDDAGNRTIRNQSSPYGVYCAEAYMYEARDILGYDVDIAIINGGGIRADLPKGDITYGEIMDIFPFYDNLCIKRVSGQDILDALEMSVKNLPDGEYGGFLHCAGLVYSVDSSIPSSVVTDSEGIFIEVNGDRRVYDVYIVDEYGRETSIVPDDMYNVVSRRYVLMENGDGYTQFDNSEVILDRGPDDTQVLIDYMNR